MKSIFFFLLFLGATFLSHAQGIFEFDTTDWNFGEIKEGTLAEHVFTYKNAGDKPLVISHIRASCGCTTPAWTREAVMPGEEGKIKVVYNSKNRPGAFYKSIMITSNAKDPNPQLKIRGKVIREQSGETEDKTPTVPKSQANLQLIDAELNLGTVQSGEELVKSINYKNTGSSDLKIRGVRAPCNCVSLKKIPTILKPGESGTLELVYKARGDGETTQQISLLSNASNKNIPYLSIRSKVVESLTPKSVVQEGKIGF